MKQATINAITAFLPTVKVTGNGILFDPSEVATVGQGLQKLQAEGKLLYDSQATRFKGKYRITVLDPVSADTGEITVRERAERADAEKIPTFSDKDFIRFMGECLKSAKQHVPGEPVYDEKGRAETRFYPYADVESIGRNFNRTDGEAVMPWQDRTSLESFNAGKTGHVALGNIREYLGQAVKYANGNREKQARLDTMVVPKGTAAE